MQPSFFKNLGPIDIEKIQNSIECQLRNIKKDKRYDGLKSLADSEINFLTFAYDNQPIENKDLSTSTVMCTEKKAKEFSEGQMLIIVKDVQLSLSVLSNIFYRDYTYEELVKLPNTKIGENCKISKLSKIERGVIVGDNVTINDGAIIKNHCVIGNNSFIDHNAIISNSIIGENVFIGRNSCIGQQGFGFSIQKKGNKKIFHAGRAIIESNVSIGSNCTIDRGSFSDTVIGNNTYFDNLCHVAHNVTVGSNSVFAAMTGIAGSAKIGDNVMTGGQAGIAGHIKIGDNVRVAAKSGVFNDVSNNKSVMGNPAINMFTFLKKYKKIYE